MKFKRLDVDFEARQIPRPRVTYTHLHHPSASGNRLICERWLSFEFATKDGEAIFFAELNLDGLGPWCRNCLRAE